MSLPGIIGTRIQRMGPDPTAVPLVEMMFGTPLRPFDPFAVTLPYAGLWRLVLWGAGNIAIGAVGGQSGALYIAERHLDAQQPLLLRPGAPSQGQAVNGDSYAILPTGEVITAPGGLQSGSPNPGVGPKVFRNNSNDLVFEATICGSWTPQGDNIAPYPLGGQNVTHGGGSPGWGPHQGAMGGYGQGSINIAGGGTPGGGGGWYDGSTSPNGGQGQILLCLMRLD